MMGQTMKDVCSFKARKGCLSSFTKCWTCSSWFDAQKSDVRVCSMSDLVNPVLHILVLPTKKVQCLMSVCLRMFLSSIIKGWTRLSLFDVQKMIFEFIRCSISKTLTYHQLGIRNELFLICCHFLCKYKSKLPTLKLELDFSCDRLNILGSNTKSAKFSQEQQQFLTSFFSNQSKYLTIPTSEFETTPAR